MGPGTWMGLRAHMLPGRLRVWLPGTICSDAGRALSRLPGVTCATANPVTGSLLVRYDERQVGLGQIGRAIGLRAAEDQPLKEATRQLALTGGALAFVAAKRLLVGSSALSRAWGSYDLAGIITVAASYPFLRSGVQATLAGRGLSGDLIIGLAGLAATVMRENLWGLSVLFLTSLTHWLLARAKARCEDDHLAQEAKDKAHRWGRLSVGAAMLTGLTTGDWRRALAALIAAAPAASALSATLPLCAATTAAARDGVDRLRQAQKAARNNQTLSALMNGAGLCLAAGGVIGPLGASLWHNMTSLIVVLTSLRLLV